LLNRLTLSRPYTKNDVINYFRNIATEIFHEQSSETQDRIHNLRSRVTKINKRFNPITKEKIPQGKEYVRKRIIGGATTFTEILDGNIARKARRKSTKTKSKKSRAVK